jgi:glycogen debranching enzyme
MKTNFGAKNFRDFIPHPVDARHPEFAMLYDKAWELGYAHIKDIPGMPQTPYMDEAFCDTQIWIWDTCFMSLFCKYGREVFPGVESLKNFYEVLYDEGSLPFVIPTEREPDFTGATPGVPYGLVIHIADNPPLFALAEYENARMLGDKEHIRSLLYEKKYLEKHYEWIENLRAPQKPKGVFHETCLISEDCGYLWEGGRSGMDNTPRGRTGAHAVGQRPNNPDMLWLDAICQQALSAEKIAALFSLLGDAENAALWQRRYEEKKKTVNDLYWDETDGFYYDIDRRDHHFYKVKTMASYWTMAAGIASEEQAKRLVSYLLDDAHFGGCVPFPALSRSDADFHTDGQYWRGGVWLPTAYAALIGLRRYGFFAEARVLTERLLSHMQETLVRYEPHTIWECYSPTAYSPAFIETGEKKTARPDFCGWSALGPISAYIEFSLGFHTVDAFENKVYWEKPKTDQKIGIENLRFAETVTDIVAEGNRVFVRANKPYTLVISGKEYAVGAGESTLEI